MKEFKVCCRTEVGGYVWLKAPSAEEAQAKVENILDNHGAEIFHSPCVGKDYDASGERDFPQPHASWGSVRILQSKVSDSLDEVYDVEEVSK